MENEFQKKLSQGKFSDKFPQALTIEDGAYRAVLVGDFNSLLEEQKKELLRSCIPLIERAFGQRYGDDLSEKEVIRFLSGGYIYCITDIENRVIGIEILRLLTVNDASVLFTSGAVIDPAHQGRHVHSNFRKLIIEQCQPDFLVGRTQSPLVYLVYTKGEGPVYPQHQVPVPNHIKSIAKSIAEQLGFSNFDPETLIQHGAYGESLYSKDTYPKIPPDSDIAQMFSALSIAHGDAFLVIKQIKF